MKKRDLVQSAINHQGGNAVPYYIDLCNETIDKYKEAFVKDFFDKDVAEDYKAGGLSLYDAVNLAIGNHMICCETPWWDWDYEKTDPGYFDPFETPEVLPIIKPDDREDLREYYKHIHKRYGVYMFAGIYGSHWEKAYFLRGIEPFLADIAGEPEFAKRLLDFIIDTNVEMLPKVLAYPYFDAVLFGSDWGSQKDLIMSPDSWRNLIKAGEARQYKPAKDAGKKVFVHSCGDIVKIMDDIVELGVDVINPIQPECMNLRMLKERYGDKLSFWGGISTQRTLPYGTPAEVSKEVETTIKLMSQNGGYITSPSQGILPDVPYENIKVLIQTAKGFC